MKEKYIKLSDALRIVNETGAWETKKRLRELLAVQTDTAKLTAFVESENPDLTGILVCYSCKEFGFFPTRYPEGKKYRYCPMCGAKVVPVY